MPTFDTPEPISATLDLVVGDVRITASDRADTVVEVRPSDASNEADVQGRRADPRRVRRRRLLVKAPKQRSLGLFGKAGSIDVTIELPAGSQVHGDASVGGRSAATAGSASAGSRPGPATSGSSRPARSTVNTGAGDITVDRVDGRRRGHHRLRPGAPRRDRRHRGDQELQRRQLDRRGRRRPAGQRGQRRASPSTGRTPASTPRPPTATSGSARSRAARSSLETAARRARGRHPRGHRRLARRQHRSSATCTTQLDAADGPEPSDETVEVRARTSLRRHRDPPLLTAEEPRTRMTTMTATQTGDRGDRAAQVLRRPASCSTASTSTSPRARSSRCSARTAPARPPWSTSCPP